ncbi:MAG: Cysteine desulfurase [Pseudomonadota bacterium]|jgi:cysteine desulfurase
MIYLDHQATTPCAPPVVEAMLPYFGARFGNPSSRAHTVGLAASAALEAARADIAGCIGGDPSGLLLTSGATEADNLAILGVARASASRGRHLVLSAIEHSAVDAPADQLAREGWQITRVLPDHLGRIQPDALARALRPDTTLVSVIAAHNEFGTVQDLAALADTTHRGGALFHTDAAQAVGKIPIDVAALGIDLLSFTAHKIYGPGGIGALWVRRGRPIVPIEPIAWGGGQERGLRPGTVPLALCVGFAAACRLAASELADGGQDRIAMQRDRLSEGLLALPGARLVGPALPATKQQRLAGNLHVYFEGCAAADLLRAVRPHLAISTGSACGSGSAAPSRSLLALGFSEDAARACVRFGVGRDTTDAQIDAAVAIVSDAVRSARGSAAAAPRFG